MYHKLAKELPMALPMAKDREDQLVFLLHMSNTVYKTEKNIMPSTQLISLEPNL